LNVALVAHDNKKILMENLCIAYRHILSKHELYATATTGRLIEEATGLPIHKYLAGHLGGGQQLGAQITHDDVDLLIFLCDPVVHMQYGADENGPMRLCDIHNIPMATNLATAEALLLALDNGDLNWRTLLK